jgi:phage tail P2-like protein
VSNAISLLPRNTTPQERALEEATARLAVVPVPIADINNPDTCPAALLPWLAWAFSVDEFDAIAIDALPASIDTEAKQRTLIKEAFDLHRLKGTAWSVKRILRLLGFGDAVLHEGHVGVLSYDGAGAFNGDHVFGDASLHWAEYDVYFPGAVTIAQGQKLVKTLVHYAPTRCHLRRLLVQGLFYDGTAKFDGTYSHGKIYG